MILGSGCRRWSAGSAGAGIGRAVDPAAAESDVTAELKRLRRENEILRQERDILKKATAFFAREGSQSQSDVRQRTIEPVITGTVAAGSLVHTDEYVIYTRLPAWGYRHKTVCHGRGEYARDDDGDGFCEVHVNTIEGFWSLLRSWLRPHRGISQDKLPLYLGFFQFVHNARRRGKALLGALVAALVA